MKNGDVFSWIRSRGREIGDEVIAWRRALHAIPELCMDTPKTEAQILQILAQIGITEVRSGVGGHGVCAVIRGDGAALCIRERKYARLRPRCAHRDGARCGKAAL